jgi:hypothetical protein
VEIKLRVAKSRFLEKESLPVTVVIANNGSAPLQVPEVSDRRNRAIKYTLRGGTYPDGITFDYGGKKPFPGSPPTHSLPPGQVLENAIPLEQMVPLGPGVFEISASIELNDGVKAQSEPISFTIGNLAIRSAEIMPDIGSQSTSLIRVLVLEGTAGHRMLYQAFFSEGRPDLGEIRLRNLVGAPPAPARAETTLAAATNFVRASLFFSRYGWSGGGAIGFEDSPKGVSVAFDLGGATVVRPALMTETGDVDVYLLRGADFRLRRFPRGSNDSREIARGTLPGTPTAACAALGQHSSALITAAQIGNDVHVIVNELGKPAKTLVVTNADLPRSSRPAAAYDHDGGIRAAIVLTENKAHKRAFVADFDFGTAGNKLQRSSTYEISEPIQAAAVAYQITESRKPRRDWAILLTDSTVVSSRNPGTPFELSGKPVLPLQLLSMSEMLYLLALDEKELLKMNMLH